MIIIYIYYEYSDYYNYSDYNGHYINIMIICYFCIQLVYKIKICLTLT